MKRLVEKIKRRSRRRKRVRRRIFGTADRPRLTVFRSNKNIYAQLVDDMAGRTLVAASTRERALGAAGCNKASAQKVGAALAEKAIQAGIKQAVFDRSGYAYHGRVRELAEAARQGGLAF